MTTTNSVGVRHKQFRVLRRSGNKYINLNERDSSWGKLPVSLVVNKLRSSEHSIVLHAVDELRLR